VCVARCRNAGARDYRMFELGSPSAVWVGPYIHRCPLYIYILAKV
jgi:hypothetical protein